ANFAKPLWRSSQSPSATLVAGRHRSRRPSGAPFERGAHLSCRSFDTSSRPKADTAGIRPRPGVFASGRPREKAGLPQEPLLDVDAQLVGELGVARHDRHLRPRALVLQGRAAGAVPTAPAVG